MQQRPLNTLLHAVLIKLCLPLLTHIICFKTHQHLIQARLFHRQFFRQFVLSKITNLRCLDILLKFSTDQLT